MRRSFALCGLVSIAPVVAVAQEEPEPPTTAELIYALRSEDGARRAAAASALGQRPDAVDDVRTVLKSSRPEVRAAAAHALGRMGPPALEAAGALLAACHPPEPKVREAVARALGELGKPAVPSVVRALEDERAGVRAGAAAALGYLSMHAASSGPKLVKALRKDEDGNVRELAAIALARIGDARAGAALSMAAISDRRWQVRKAAVEGLGGLRAEGGKAVPRLGRAAKDERVEVRLAVAIALGRVGRGQAAAVAPLGALLRDPEQTVRDEAARALGELELAEAAEPLLDALEKEESWLVRRNAVRALGKLKDLAPHVNARLKAVSKGDENARVRKAARRALEPPLPE